MGYASIWLCESHESDDPDTCPLCRITTLEHWLLDLYDDPGGSTSVNEKVLLALGISASKAIARRTALPAKETT